MTRARIWGCTIFIDYAESLVHVVLMQELETESTLAAKQEFEDMFTIKGVNVEHYHTNIGRFADPAWKEDCKVKGQKLTFCGIGAHHQNMIIKYLALTRHTLLLHAIRFWPEYISQILWPFAIKCAENRINILHIDIEGLTPEMRLKQFSYIWMPMIAKMGTKSETWHLPWTLTSSCMQCWFGDETQNWFGLTSIPHHI
ncbi:hypothetical protein ACHAWX_002035 [Stephanocyclus meneghinianus]